MKALLVDFDGTIVTHKFPLIGEPLEGAFETLFDLRDDGWKLILWTCREDTIIKKNGLRIVRNYLSDAVKFCRERGLEWDAVNEGLPEFDIYDPDANFIRRKPHVTWVIDDTNIGGFIGWKKVRELLLPCATT